MALGIISDVMKGVPKEIQIIIAIAIFLNVGRLLISGVLLLWNVVVVNGMNAINGCALNPAVCQPAVDGLYILGVNFLDFWILNALIFFPAIAVFAISWYGSMFKMSG